MGGEALALDVDRARVFASECRQVGTAAGHLAHEVDSLLGRGRQSPRAGRLLAEVDEQLGLLARVVEGTSHQVELADRWSVAGLFGGAGARLAVALDRQRLWHSLRDTTGVQAIDVAPFELAESMRRMDPVAWRLAMSAPGCRSFGAGRYYGGGGALRGPDGLLYPVVVPHLVTDEGHFTIDAALPAAAPTVASLGGGDPGWTMVGYRTGVERIVEQPTGWWQVLTGVAVATGLGVSPGVDDGYLSGILFRAGTRPQFSTSIPAAAPTEPFGGQALTGLEPMVWLVIDGQAGQYPIGEVPDLVPDSVAPDAAPRPLGSPLATANAADNLLAVATGALTGFVAARDLDHGKHRAYEVMFEQHPDGRRRSRVQTFTLEHGPAGVALYGWHLFLDADGDLHQSPVSYQTQPVLVSDDVVLAHNPLDPEFTQRVGGQAFGATLDPTLD